MTKLIFKEYCPERGFLFRRRTVTSARYLLIFAITLFLQTVASAQVGISNTTITPDASSILELRSTTSGFLSPRMTTVQRDAIALPARGLIIYNTTISQFNYFDGTSWRIMGSSSEWALNGNSGTTVGTNFLGTTDAQDLAIYTNNAERIRVQSGGNVGIGTASPKRLFHVLQNSSGTPSMFALDNPNTTDGNGMSLSFRGTTTGAGATSFNEFSSIQSIFNTHDYPTKASSLVFFTSAKGFIYERMRIGATGNIGIGNAAPTNALHVTAVANPLRLEGLETGVSTDQILTVDAKGVVRQQTAASVSSLNVWSQLGNTGTVDGTNFIGTTDNIPFNIRVNNQNAGRIDNKNSITALGYQSLNNNKGTYNTALGHQSMFSNTTGNYNTANGAQALYSNTTGDYNTANGYQSLYSNTEGVENVANGYLSLYSNINGYNNTATGNESLYSNTKGYNNTANGYQSLYSNIEGVENVANGYQSLYSNTKGYNNTANGYQSLYSNTAGIENVANGYQSLYSNTEGYNNTANGYQSLYSNTGGIENVANGYQSLYSNTEGYNNTANGYQSLFSNTEGYNNTANGYTALYKNTTGRSNTAIGYEAGLNNTSGTSNTFIGYNTGLANTTGNNNTFLGLTANASSANLTNSTAIGYNAIVGASNSIVLGATGTDQVSVGIGTTTPNSYLETAGSFGTAIITTTSNITLDKTHFTVIITGGTPAITLPVAGSGNNRRSYRIINQNPTDITISSYIGFTGVGSTTVPAHSKIEIQSNGINWYRVD